MITQKRFVEACHKQYVRRGLEPGNPLHGPWHRAHYPLPACLGGTEWVWLLKHHHAIQGVIQSEEVQHRCIYHWEVKLVPRYYRPFAEKWAKDRRRNPNNPRRRKLKRQPDLIIRKNREVIEDWHRTSWETLLVGLYEWIDTNPLPGEQLRLFALAKKYFPGVPVWEWCAIFSHFGIDRTARHYFPVDEEVIDIEELEQRLLAMVAEDNTLPASALSVALACSAGSKRYREAKNQLTERGWRWAHKRVGPTTIRTIRVPHWHHAPTHPAPVLAIGS